MPKSIIKRYNSNDRATDGNLAPSPNGARGRTVTVTSSGQTVRSVREMLFSDSRKAASLSFESLIKKNK
jgi:hypothetical protein